MNTKPNHNQQALSKTKSKKWKGYVWKGIKWILKLGVWMYRINQLLDGDS